MNWFAQPGDVALSLLLPLGLGNLFGFFRRDVFLLDVLVIFSFLHCKVGTPGRQHRAGQTSTLKEKKQKKSVV